MQHMLRTSARIVNRGPCTSFAGRPHQLLGLAPGTHCTSERDRTTRLPFAQCIKAVQHATEIRTSEPMLHCAPSVGSAFGSGTEGAP